MDERSVTEQHARQDNLPQSILPGNSTCQDGKVSLIRSVARLIRKGGLSLARFLVNTGLFRKQGMIILSQHDQANITATELRRITTLITVRRLNMVKHLEMFLNALAHILPPDTNFVGCFSPAKGRSASPGGSVRSDGIAGLFFHDRHTEWHVLNRSLVSEMLERNGLSLISMTEMNGVTWFCSRKKGDHGFMTA
ncbi:MAG: hypothetical protein WAV93_01105 [Bacteroidales bacterium]